MEMSVRSLLVIVLLMIALLGAIMNNHKKTPNLLLFPVVYSIDWRYSSAYYCVTTSVILTAPRQAHPGRNAFV